MDPLRASGAIVNGYVTVKTAERRLGLSRDGVFGLLAANLIEVSPARPRAEPNNVQGC
jgi:hypothetical protein